MLNHVKQAGQSVQYACDKQYPDDTPGSHGVLISPWRNGDRIMHQLSLIKDLITCDIGLKT